MATYASMDDKSNLEYAQITIRCKSCHDTGSFVIDNDHVDLDFWHSWNLPYCNKCKMNSGHATIIKIKLLEGDERKKWRGGMK